MLKFLEEKGNKRILEDILRMYHKDQLIVAIEELSELQKELCKTLRGKLNIDNITEEMADVYIMLEQIKIYFDISQDEIDRVIQYKLDRTKERYL